MISLEEDYMGPYEKCKQLLRKEVWHERFSNDQVCGLDDKDSLQLGEDFLKEWSKCTDRQKQRLSTYSRSLRQG